MACAERNMSCVCVVVVNAARLIEMNGKLSRLSCISGFVCANGCENHINIGEPRHSSSENKDTIYVLAIDEWFNSTKCTWKFSTKSDFLLNLFFLNYTSLVPAGSDCKICYYMVRVFDSSTNTSFVYGPYCGQKQRGIRVSGVITIELVAQRQQYISGLSLAILVEASSKGKLSLYLQNSMK